MSDRPEPLESDAAALALDAEALGGHTVEELSDYLDRDRTPVDPGIEASPACRNALAALARLREVSQDVFLQDAEEEGDVTPGWVAALLAGIDLDAHAGADFPIGEDPQEPLLMTEGALRGLVRSAGDTIDGVLIGRVRIEGDLGNRAAPVRVRADVVVVHGFAIPTITALLRDRIMERMTQHTRIGAVVVDLAVRDVLVHPQGAR